VKGMSRAHGAIIALAVALGADVAASGRAGAASLWVVGWGSNDWSASAQGMEEGGSLFAGPPSDFVTPVYVTSFDVWTNVTSVITSPARTETLYVGGWPSEFDSFAGRAPSGEVGVLQVHSDLTTGDDAYVWIGMRDAVGIVEHTAGRIAAEHGSGAGRIGTSRPLLKWRTPAHPRGALARARHRVLIGEPATAPWALVVGEPSSTQAGKGRAGQHVYPSSPTIDARF